MNSFPLRFGLVSVLLFGVACSGSDGGDGENSSGTGGSSSIAGGGSGGSTSSSGGVSTTGGGTPSSGTTPGSTTVGDGVTRIAVSFNVSEGCGFTGWYDVPAVAGGHPVTAAGPTTLLAHGDYIESSYVTAYCTIPGGSTPTVVIDFTHKGKNVDISGPLSSAGGAMTVIIGDNASDYILDGGTDTACQGTVLSSFDGGFLMKVVCNPFENEAAGTTCKLSEGYLYAENCSG